MKTKTLVSILILVLAVLIIAGSCATHKNVYAQEKPSVEDIAGTWVNTDMKTDKFIMKTDGTWVDYQYLTVDKPSYTGTFTIDDSWVDKKENKYFKIHSIMEEGLGVHSFHVWKLNESGTTLEINSHTDHFYREGDTKKYPAGINPHPTDSYYRIYYRQE